jgi:hypothetical protein
MALRVLLLTPQFYEIEKVIISVLEESGYEVVWLENKTLSFDYHGTRSKFKILRRIYFLLFSPQVSYLKRALRKKGNLRFDVLFSINGHSVCPFLFRKLKRDNPNLYSVLYLWDSFSMYDWSDEIKLFNKVYSFDSQDCIKYKLAYKPNFYIKPGRKASIKTVYDLFFVGKFSPERLSVLDKVVKSANEYGLICFVKVWPAYRILFHNYYVYHILRTFNLKSSWVKKYLMNYEAVDGILEREYMITESIDYIDVQDRLLNSNVVLDFPYPDQTGYTHRLIEALANGKKVLTTNTGILKEDFYNPSQIHILDPKFPAIEIEWLKEKSIFPVVKYFHNLELSVWVNSILNAAIVKDKS